MNFMNCCSCAGICQINNTGICLGCQRGFTNTPQEDAWIHSKERKLVKMKERETEMENSLKEPKKTKIPMSKRRTLKEGKKEINNV